jgi:hypothetical protein
MTPEYRVVVKTLAKDFEQALNEAAREGWQVVELVSNVKPASWGGGIADPLVFGALMTRVEGGR